MKIIASTATFQFEPIFVLNIDKNELQKKLSEQFPKIDTIQMPQNAPPELPRFVAVSHHGYSNIMISTNSVQFSTRFDEEYNGDWDNKCRPYIKKYADSIFSSICTYYKKMLFCGLTLSLIKNTDNNSTEELEKLYLKEKFVNKSMYDIALKQTFVEDDTYYLNITLQNQRLLPNDDISNIKSFSSIEKTNVIGAVLDINDRFAANYRADYISSKEKFNRIIDLTTDTLNKQIEKLNNQEL